MRALLYFDDVVVEVGMRLPLNDCNGIGRDVFVRDKPGLAWAADAEPFSLTNCVEVSPFMTADFFPIGCNKGALLWGEVGREEGSEASLTYEANACAIFFIGDGEPLCRGDLSHLAFMHTSDWEEDVPPNSSVDRVEIVALVFVAVEAAKELPLSSLAVVTRCEEIGAEAFRLVIERFKLNFCIAGDVGIRCAARLKLIEKVCKDFVPVFLRKVDCKKWNINCLANAGDVFAILLSRARAIGLFPVAHEKGKNVVSLLFKEKGADG